MKQFLQLPTLILSMVAAMLALTSCQKEPVQTHADAATPKTTKAQVRKVKFYVHNSPTYPLYLNMECYAPDIMENITAYSYGLDGYVGSFDISNASEFRIGLSTSSTNFKGWSYSSNVTRGGTSGTLAIFYVNDPTSTSDIIINGYYKYPWEL